MKNSLRMIGISIILWLGLGIGLANAVTSTLTISSNGKVNHLSGIINSLGVNGNRIYRSAVKGIDVHIAALVLPDSANTASVSRTVSSPSSSSNVTESSPTDTGSLIAPVPKNNFSDHALDAKNSPRVSAHRSYAMLLVGLGLLVFTARRRTDVA